MAKRLIVIGGGFSGVCTARMVATSARFPVRVTIVEPAASLGAGSAYRSTDPSHRLNGPVYSHSIDPADPLHLLRWCEQTGLFKQDPRADTAQGMFIRRADFARYLAQMAHDFVPANAGTTITHRRSAAQILRADARGYCVTSSDGEQLHADAVVLATGNPAPRVPFVLDPLATHPAVIVDPWNTARIGALDAASDLAIMGSGLTAADTLATLLTAGHRGSIEVFSRRGLRPSEFAHPDPSTVTCPTSTQAAGNELMRQIDGLPPAWILPALQSSPTVCGLLRVLRARIAQQHPEPWQQTFDALRNVVWQVWPQLPDAQKKRFLSRLRPWYDVHRFRIPPQTASQVNAAVASGQVRFVAARLGGLAALADGSGVDLTLVSTGQRSRRLTVAALINCTGFDLAGPPEAGSMLDRARRDGLLMPDGSGLGYTVNGTATVIDRAGNATPRLRLVGPPSAGKCGDPLGVIFISTQIRRMLPDLLNTLTG